MEFTFNKPDIDFRVLVGDKEMQCGNLGDPASATFRCEYEIRGPNGGGTDTDGVKQVLVEASDKAGVLDLPRFGGRFC